MTKIKKTIAGVLGFAIALSLVGGIALTTKADTISDLQAQIASLTAQLSKLAGGSVTASATFNTNLTVGSKGADVTALQTWLIAKGYTIAAGATGNFGPQTKAALAAYQAASGITPAAGYFGPITRAKVNASGSTAVGTGTGTGTGTGSTGTTVGSVVNDGTDGSLLLSTSSYVSSGVQLKKGDTKDIVAARLQATSGKVGLTRVDVHFNLRPWLYFSTLTLHDSNGKVIATKTLSGASDATEVTVGSDYLVRFDNVDYVVTPGNNVDLVVGGTVLSATDKIANGQIVNVTFGQNGIRTNNGVGYEDTVGASADLNGQASATGITAQTGAGVNNFTFSSTGSVADIYARISPNSPIAGPVNISATQTTSNVVLGLISLKSSNQASTLNTITVGIAGTFGTSAELSNVRLFNGSTSYGGSWNGSSVQFTNLNIPLTQDAWQDFTVEADAAATSTNGTVYVSLSAGNNGNIVATDVNYNTATVETNTVTSNTQTLTTSALVAQNTSASATSFGNNQSGYNTTYQFTLANSSNNDLFISATSSVALATSTNGVVGSSTIATRPNVVSPVQYAGDVVVNGVTTVYDIPAGSSRSFTYTGTLHGATNAGSVNLSIAAINYGTTSGTPTGQQVTANLQNLIASGGF